MSTNSTRLVRKVPGVQQVTNPAVRASAVLIFIVALFAWPAIVNNNYYANVAVVALIYVLLGLGMDLLLGYAGLLHAGFAALYGVGAYTLACGMLKAGLPFWGIVPVSGILAAIVAVLIGAPGLRVSGLYFVLVTLAFGQLATIAADNSASLGGANGLFGIAPANLFKTQILTERASYWLLLPIVILLVALVRSVTSSHWGRTWNYSRIDEIATTSLGANVFKGRLQVTGMAGFLAGIAGAFFAVHQSAVSPASFTFQESVTIILIVALGGLRSLPGLVLGVVLIAVLPEVLRGFDQYSMLVYGIAIVLVLRFRPEGLVPRLGSKAPSDPHVQISCIAPQPEVLFRPETRDGDSLSIRKLKKQYGGVRAVSDVEFAVLPGEIVGLIGPNGAGKTTVLNLIGGQATPDSGTVRWRSQDLSKLKGHQRASRGLARTFQTPRLFPTVSVLENVKAGAEPFWSVGLLPTMLNSKRARAEEAGVEQRAFQILSFIDTALAARALDPVESLSYGMLRKVEIARSLMSRPSVLLLDEPAAGLNAVETSDLGDLLKVLAEHGIAILLVEHDMDLVMTVTTRVVVLDHGEVLASGNPLEVSRMPVVIDSYLGRDVSDEAWPATEGTQ